MRDISPSVIEAGVKAFKLLREDHLPSHEEIVAVVYPACRAADPAWVEMREALESLGKCGSCGGTGRYKDKGFRGERGFVSEEVECRKCDGTGVNPIARAALSRATSTEKEG